MFLVSQASSENSTSIGVRNEDADLACEVLNEEFSKEIEMGELSLVEAERNLATVAIVGENMKHTPGIAGKLFGEGADMVMVKPGMPSWTSFTGSRKNSKCRPYRLSGQR